MQSPPPEPKPKRSRRMVVWMIAVPVVILLLALAGANWKTFHLAYAKHLIASDDLDTQDRGVRMVFQTHIRMGMTLEEVRRLLAPATVTKPSYSPWRGGPLDRFPVHAEGSFPTFNAYLFFDEDDRLRWIEYIPKMPLGGK